jgi:lipopolysaccharide/colanic/teichoic acid biosynthesis glycosyltransferase
VDALQPEEYRYELSNLVGGARLRAKLAPKFPIADAAVAGPSVERPRFLLDDEPHRLIALRFQHVSATDGAVERPWYRLSKRLFDVAVSLLLLTMLGPILLLIAVIVRLDSSGPSLFIQQRIGQHGRIFGMFKFRTMVNGQQRLLDEPIHKRSDDPRVTRVGRLLRATSLDEVPQLLNVLRGDMSLVGPRPEIVEIAVRHYEPWQFRRLEVPQGMTGWWQITGRGTKLMRDHTEDDLYYVEHASFWFDLKILLMTARTVVGREGAF